MTPLPRVGLVGVNGYGRTHLRNAARLHDEGRLRLLAYADVAPTAAAAVAEHCAEPPRAYPGLGAMLDAEALDVAVLGTPIPLHAEMIEQAFGHGVSVLVEKPPVVTVQDVDRLLGRQENGGPACQVGFQSARAPVMRTLARLARSGALGTVEHVGLVGKWLRADSYYARTGWAGRLTHEGRYVLDGTLTNPLAHGLMNTLILAGDDDDHPATPATVQAELYRCRDTIEGDDTASVRITTTNGRTILLAVTLCARTQVEPYVFVKGTLATAKAFYTAGALEFEPSTHGDAVAAGTEKAPDLLANLVNVVGGTREQLLCPLRMCRGFVLALNGMYESAGRPRPVSPHFTSVHVENGERWVHLVGVDDLVERCAHQGQLFSEAGAGWASPTRAFSLANYRNFDLSSC
ncbi:Gfo/Idh/MocA family protein [Actinopolymorpha pittospori]|uniref:Dehydrogenase n=1 Tax=Actinopolymorpha pittospori TaxID=648752 RepID=A0A927N1W2_9ACTN|nr:Gfo/Idh/MocA family oxidoreductase [Actinopolymorpha pittospori]MBE1611135.1 putative dehydrogenase [Actinopolymorpha pittospori]